MNQLMIGFCGLSHLGLNSAVASAAKGFNVIAYHNDSVLISKLKKGEPQILEPQLQELMKLHQEKITFSSELSSLISCDIVYIAEDVPTNECGESNLNPINQIIHNASCVIRKESLLVILCQVPPGFTRSVKWYSEQKFYQVETLVFGKAIERALYPERIILGCKDSDQTLHPKLLQYLKAFKCPILPMKYESAELAKISINMCLISSVTTANTLAEICEHIDADWAEIVPALRLDKRIGEFSYLKAGLGISGGNLERDLSTVLKFSEKYKTDGRVLASWLKNSKHRTEWAWETIKKLGFDKRTDAKISILGITYKENTHSTKNSPSLVLFQHLKNQKVVAFDPVANLESTPSYVNRADSMLEAIKGADLLAIMTPWPEFKDIKPKILAKEMKGRVVLDPYRILNFEEIKNVGLQYFSLGLTTRIKYKKNLNKS